MTPSLQHYQLLQEGQGGCPVLGERSRANRFVDEADVTELLRVGCFDLDEGTGRRLPHFRLRYLQLRQFSTSIQYVNDRRLQTTTKMEN